MSSGLARSGRLAFPFTLCVTVQMARTLETRGSEAEVGKMADELKFQEAWTSDKGSYLFICLFVLEWGWGEEQRNRDKRALCSIHDPEILTRAEIKSWRLNRLSPPGAPYRRCFY